MNAEPQTHPSRFPILRRCVYVVIALLTLIVLFYAEEKLRGKHAWNRYRKAAEARGVQFDFAAMIPPPVPDEQNAAINPLVQVWLPKLNPDYTNLWPRVFGAASERVQTPASRRSNNQDDRRMTDFVSWQRAFADEAPVRDKKRLKKPVDVVEKEPTAEEQLAAARAILSQLKIYEEPLNILRTASQKPRVRYPVYYNLDDPMLILLPHLAQLNGIVRELKMQCLAELAVGETERAFQDLRLMLWLTDSVNDEPLLISHLVRIAAQQQATQPIWEGMAEHKWSDAQLKEIQEGMLRKNFAQSTSFSMSAERTMGVKFIQVTLKRHNFFEVLSNVDAGFDSSGGGNPINKIGGWLIPSGWLYLEMLNHSRMMDGMIAGGWDTTTKTFHPKMLDENEKAFQKQLKPGFTGFLHHQTLSHLLLPALTKASRRFCRAQSTANQVALACALERYRLKHHAYPETLTALVPNFIADIPNEVVSTNAMRYVRNGDGYLLYSEGWDGVDDGGVLLSKATSGKPEKGDWVWRMDKSK